MQNLSAANLKLFNVSAKSNRLFALCNLRLPLKKNKNLVFTGYTLYRRALNVLVKPGYFAIEPYTEQKYPQHHFSLKALCVKLPANNVTVHSTGPSILHHGPKCTKERNAYLASPCLQNTRAQYKALICKE